MERNHNVRVGDVFVRKDRDECGHSCAFFQVVRLKGKTMAEIGQIRVKFSVDKTCDTARWQCRMHPQRGNFFDETEITVVRIYTNKEDGEHFLRTVAESKDMRDLLLPYKHWRIYHCSGYDGRYIIEKYALLKDVQE